MDKIKLSERIRNHESFLIANDGQFLGKLSLNRFDSESISNEYGSYGSKYSVSSIFNIYSNYGSKYSSLSPYNQYTNTPPLVYLKGTKFGFLTKNKYVSFNSIDPDELFSWMKHHNLQY